MSDWRDYVAPVGAAVTGIGAALWRFFVARRKRWDDQEDADKKRVLDELTAVRGERDAARRELQEMTARWVREVQLGAERAMQPAPPPHRIPDSLPPPKFKEPEPIRTIREAVETKTLRRIRRNEPDPNSDDTIRNFNVEAAVAPPKPEPAPYRQKQASISVVEVDARRKTDKR